ncbi:MAG: TolC family protein [Bacteroidales bacterium]|jgi:outer membrane protein TolC|nr:TolC family protein [Bacteroidales bacterium]
MTKFTNILICLFCFQALAVGQITLDECIKKARENYPLIKQFDLIEQSKSYNLAAVNKNWLPHVSLSGKASWQSDVTEFPERFLSMLENLGITDVSFPSRDQYNVSLNLSQTIWDGGITATQKKMATVNAEINKEQTEVNLYALYSQINQLYFNVLSLTEQLKQNQLFIEELERNYKTIESYVVNGIALRSDLDNVKVSILDAKQRKTEMQSFQKSGLAVLSAFIGQKVDSSETLVKPEHVAINSNLENRPEMKLLSAQNRQFEIQTKMLYTKGMPRIALFATGAVGNPGLNMFKSGFTPFFIGGVNLFWNFGGLYTKQDEKRNLVNLQKNTEIQKEVFLFNTHQKTTQKNAEVEKLTELLKQDDEIIALRVRIKNASAAKVENGTITVSEYLRDVTHENIARQVKTLHEINLIQTISQLRIENGEMSR